MARVVDVDQLVGAAEIAARLGSKRTVYADDLHCRHPDFPAPATRLKAAGLVWDWREVEALATLTGRIK